MAPEPRSSHFQSTGRKALFFIGGVLVLVLIAVLAISAGTKAVTNLLNPERGGSTYGDCRPLADPQCVDVPLETIEEVTAATVPLESEVLASWASPNPVLGRPGPFLSAVIQIPAERDEVLNIFANLSEASPQSRVDPAGVAELENRGAVDVMGQASPQGSICVGQLNGGTVVYVSTVIR